MIISSVKSWYSQTSLQSGVAIVTILVFGAIFSMLLVALVSTVVTEEKSLRATVDRSTALQMAESGLEYMRWYLAHNPQDYNGWQNVSKDGDGKYVFTEDYVDPITAEVTGELEYVVTPEEFCGLTSSASVLVTATSFADGQSYAIEQVHAKDTAANYAYIYNDDVAAGSDRLIRGRYHSNSEVEMNGKNDSVVSSSQTDGVYGNPVNPLARTDLWQDEVGTIDFNALSLDLSAVRDAADTYNGSPAGDDLNDRLFETSQSCYNYSCWGGWWYGWQTCQSCSGGEAFEVELVSDGDTDNASIKVWELSDLTEISRSNVSNENEKYCGPGSSVDFSDYDDSDHVIENIPTCDDGRSSYLGEFALDNSCPVAFFDGDVFLHGTADSKLLIASGDLDSVEDTNVYLFNTINYASTDGSDGLTVVSEGDIKIPYSVPDDMGVRGIFIAQSGRYGRDNYTGSRFGARDFLQTVGTIVSNEGGGTQWVSSGGSFVSGFRDRENYYDRSLARRPPPLTPTVTENYSYVEWRDEQN